MAGDPQGLILFPGIDQPIRASYCLTHGISPGTCTIEMVPQSDFIAEGGLLQFVYGDVTLSFPDCKVDQFSLQFDSRGFVWQMAVFDRRWRWAFGAISGSYNTRREDGRPYPNRVQTAAALASLCLDAMNEQGYDVSQVPAGVYPVVDWNYDNPAQSLQHIADECGCRVVLRLDNTVALIPAGTGDALPEDDTVTADSLTINPPERPDSLAYVCGPTRYQFDITLRAVGLETDGTIKKINDLSYKPSGGWGETDRTDFSGVGQGQNARTREFWRTLARESVWRWYQIALEMLDETGKPYTVDVPKYGKVTKLKQLLILNDQVELMTDIDGIQRPKPAQVVGVFTDYRLAEQNTATETLWWRGFSLDPERGLVKFSDQCYKRLPLGKDSDIYVEASIKLRTAVWVRPNDTWAWDRYVRTLDFGTNYGTGPKVYRHDESFLAVAQDYDNSGKPTTLTDNKDAINNEADTYLQAALAELQTTLPQNLTYAGLREVSPDGAIAQVEWSVGPEGASTRASRNNEFSASAALYPVRRLFEFARNLKTLNLPAQVNSLARQIAFRPPPPQ